MKITRALTVAVLGLWATTAADAQSHAGHRGEQQGHSPANLGQCQADAAKFCAEFLPGRDEGDRERRAHRRELHQCMLEHAPELTPECRQLVEENSHGDHERGRHGRKHACKRDIQRLCVHRPSEDPFAIDDAESSSTSSSSSSSSSSSASSEHDLDHRRPHGHHGHHGHGPAGAKLLRAMLCLHDHEDELSPECSEHMAKLPVYNCAPDLAQFCLPRDPHDFPPPEQAGPEPTPEPTPEAEPTSSSPSSSSSTSEEAPEDGVEGERHHRGRRRRRHRSVVPPRVVRRAVDCLQEHSDVISAQCKAFLPSTQPVTPEDQEAAVEAFLLSTNEAARTMGMKQRHHRHGPPKGLVALIVILSIVGAVAAFVGLYYGGKKIFACCRERSEERAAMQAMHDHQEAMVYDVEANTGHVLDQRSLLDNPHGYAPMPSAPGADEEMKRPMYPVVSGQERS